MDRPIPTGPGQEGTAKWAVLHISTSPFRGPTGHSARAYAIFSIHLRPARLCPVTGTTIC